MDSGGVKPRLPADANRREVESPRLEIGAAILLILEGVDGLQEPSIRDLITQAWGDKQSRCVRGSHELSVVSKAGCKLCPRGQVTVIRYIIEFSESIGDLQPNSLPAVVLEGQFGISKEFD